MKGLDRIASAIEKELDEKDSVREIAIKVSRDLIRQSKDIIAAMNKKKATKGLIRRMVGETARLKKRLERHPDIFFSGYVEAAHCEVVEVCVLLAVLENRQVPTPKELNVTPQAFLLGLGDVVGELRRLAVDSLMRQRFGQAKDHLSEMEEIYDVLMRFDYPTAIVALRKKKDIARALVERTRGEILVSQGEKELKDRMDKVIIALGSTEMKTNEQEQTRKGRSGRRRRGKRK